MKTRKPHAVLHVVLQTAPLLAGFAILAASGSAWAQSCGGSAGPPGAGGAVSDSSWLRSGQGAARLSEEYEVKDHSFRGAHRVANDFRETLFISRTSLDVRYGVSDDWTAELTATYPHFTYRLKPPGGQRSERHFRGPGDTLVLFGRRFATGQGEEDGGAACSVEVPQMAETHTAAPTLSLWAGFTLPTGEAERPNPAFVTRDVSVANLQTGTGTFDPLLRARFDWPQHGWALFAQTDLRLPVYENRYRYRTGDSEALLAGAAVPVVSKVSASLTLMLQRVGRDTFRGDDVGVGGARWLYAVPGASWQVTDTVAVDFSVRMPLYRRTQTKLSDSKVAYQLGVSLRF